MNHHRTMGVVMLLALSAGLMWGAPCRAALGGDEASIALDRSTLHGDLSSTSTSGYRIREISNAEGMRVREYLNGGGAVFAVAWNGPAVPDLRQLLGAYFEQYSASVRNLKSVGLHRAARFAGPAVTVEFSGHMRAYSGRAYLPAQFPAQFTLGELR